MCCHDALSGTSVRSNGRTKQTETSFRLRSGPGRVCACPVALHTLFVSNFSVENGSLSKTTIIYFRNERGRRRKRKEQGGHASTTPPPTKPPKHQNKAMKQCMSALICRPYERIATHLHACVGILTKLCARAYVRSAAAHLRRHHPPPE